MKKLIAFIVCLALCISSVLIGAMNVANSTKGTVADSALEGLAAGVTSTPKPEVENAEGAIQPDTTKDNYWVLTGNVTVSSTDDLADVQAALNAGGTFDGQGYTLTTEIAGPMFTSLAGGTIKNLVVDGDITVNAEVGVFAAATTGAVTFDTVKVIAKITRDNSVGGFLGAVKAPTTFTNCEFAGTIKGGSGYAGGFSVINTALATFENCTVSGTVNKANNIGGFIGAARSAVSINNCKSTVTLDSATNCANSTDKTNDGSGGFLGKINAANQNITITNSISQATILAAADSTTARRNAGGFIGTILHVGADKADTADIVEGIYIKNCTSDCTFQITKTFSGKREYTAFGGFVGQFDGENKTKTDRSLTFENCTNETDLNWTDADQTQPWINYGGFLGNIFSKEAYATIVNFQNCVNNGNVDINAKVDTNIGGFIGRNSSKSAGNTIIANNCVNNGYINYTAIDGTTSSQGYTAGGFLALSLNMGTWTVDNFVNNGDITLNVNVATNQRIVAGGVFAFLGTGGTDTTVITDSANYGDITITSSATTGSKMTAGGCIGIGLTTKTTSIENFVNAGNITATCTSDTGAAAVDAGGIVNVPTGTVTIKNAVNVGTVTATNKADATKAKTYAINGTGSATGCVNASAVENKTFTAVAGEGAAWTTTISKELYTALGTNVEFGAIITLADYVDVIGEFTHANFDAYYTAHKAAIDAKAGKELGRLYEIAKFDNGQTTLTDAELVGDNYVVNVTLNGAYDYDYVVRTFVKIGDLYIYNN